MTTAGVGTLTERVAGFTAGLDLAAVPPDVVEKAKVTLLHDLGVGLAGHRLAATGYAFAKEHGGCDPARGARLLIDGTPVTVEAFALATGALVHARTQDDTQIAVSTHLGATTLPALLALADRADASGRDVLTAMIAGYEAASAIAERHAARSTARGFRATSVYGPFAGLVEAEEGALVVDGRRITAPAETDPARLPWDELDVDVVIESTGRFRARADAEKHLEAGAIRLVHLGRE